MNAPRLLGKVIIEGEIKALTGIRIGGAAVGVQIGGIDNPVIRDPVTQRPYIPGSSIKGKIRSLLTKALGKSLRVLVRDQNIRIHWCEPEEYAAGERPCEVCRMFGMPVEYAQEPTRLIVCDAPLLPDTLEVEDEDRSLVRKRWADVPAELGYTEVKMEAVIDVVTSAATPRQMERVPPGALFSARMLLSVYDGHDRECLRALFLGMRLLEDDYLGSSGSRGYGRICFQKLRLVWRPVEHYRDPEGPQEDILGQELTTAELAKRFDVVAQRIWANAG